MPAASSQEKVLLQSHCKPLGPSAWVCRNHPCPVGRERSNHSCQHPPKEAEESLKVVGSSIMATCQFRHPISGKMYIDMITCILSIVVLGFNTMAGDHLVQAL